VVAAVASLRPRPYGADRDKSIGPGMADTLMSGEETRIKDGDCQRDNGSSSDSTVHIGENAA
jgi:hypothetical protein